jgi:hypothetical protein
MKASNKTILYTITGVGATSKRTPVAIFADENKCRPFAVAVMEAAKRGDVAEVKALNMGHLVTEEGTIAVGLRFQRVTLPYEPEVTSAADDPFADEVKPTT